MFQVYIANSIIGLNNSARTHHISNYPIKSIICSTHYGMSRKPSDLGTLCELLFYAFKPYEFRNSGLKTPLIKKQLHLEIQLVPLHHMPVLSYYI